MPRPHEIIAQIHRLNGVIERSERRLLADPADFDTLTLAETSMKLLRGYEEDFAKAAAAAKEHVIRYTVHHGRGETPSFRDVGAVFTSFETAVLLTAQAKLMDQPQRTRRLEPPVRAAALRYGYLFSDRPDQLGIAAATSASDRQLRMSIDEGPDPEPGHPHRLRDISAALLLESAKDVFAVANRGEKPEAIAKFARSYGSAIVLELNEWSELHMRTYLDAEAEWITSDRQTEKFHVRAPKLETLHYSIEKLGDDVRRDVVEMKGAFYSLNVRTRHFTFEAVDGTKIHGTAPRHIFDENKPAKLPHQYQVIFGVKRRFNEALGIDVTTFEILSLEEIK